MSKITAESFRQWNQCIADIAIIENRERILELLVCACEALTSVDASMIWICGKAIRPVWLFDDAPSSIRPQISDVFTSGAYLLDPFYRAGINGIASGLYYLSDIAPHGFKQSQYYRRYYKQAMIIDEVSFITQLPDNCFASISLVKLEGSNKFSKAEFGRLQNARSLVDRILINFWEQYQRENSNSPSEIYSQLEVALQQFGQSLLTSREAEIIRLYLHGHSTRSTSERLDISQHTVSMHRKNAYSKLDINSQYELFHLFIDSMYCFDPVLLQDPLIRYMDN